MSKKFNTRIVHKHDTSENWEKAVNFIPLNGELIIYDDLRQIKIGNGVDNVNNLPFSNNASLIAIDDGEGNIVLSIK